MQSLITICARAGSKGLPGKNTKLFNGRPLISWTITQAIGWGKGDIAVSSDSKALLQIANVYGLLTIERPPELAQDTTPKIDAIRHALMAAEKAKKQTYDLVIDLDVTNCHRTISDIQRCYKIFKEKKPSTLFSVVDARKNPYFNQVQAIDGKVILCKEPNVNVFCRQDAPKVFDLNNCIYIYARNWLVNEANKSPICEDSELYIMPDYTAFDTDTLLDFHISEFLMRKYG